MLLSLIVLGLVLTLDYQVEAAKPTEACVQKRYGMSFADRDDECIYYMCTGYRGWETRRCLQSGGAVPKTFRRRYSKAPTRLNLCRAYSKTCLKSVFDKKRQTTETPVTPPPPKCVQNLEFSCRGNRKCCEVGEDGNDLTLECILPAGRCEEPCFCDEFVVPSEHNIVRDPASGNNQCGTPIKLECEQGLVQCEGDRGGRQVTCVRDEATGLMSYQPPNDQLLKCCPPCECPLRAAPGNGTRSTPEPAGSGNGDNEGCGTVEYECNTDFEICQGDDPENECTETGWDKDAPECCPVEEDCAALSQSCTSIDCCDNESLQCSFAGACCRDRDGVCVDDDDCCLGLVCNVDNNRCTPPVIINCTEPIDIVFAQDTSCSIDPGDKLTIRDFLTSFARALDLKTPPNGVHMGALTFNEGAQHVAYLKDSPSPKDAAFVQTMENMNLTEVGCKTHTFEALRQVNEIYFTTPNGDRPDAKNVAILLSDGVTVPTKRKTDTWARAKDIRDRGITMLVVGLPQGCGKDKEGCEQQQHPNAMTEWGNIVGWIEGVIKNENKPPIVDFEKLANIYSANFSNLLGVIDSIGRAVCGDEAVTIFTGIPPSLV